MSWPRNTIRYCSRMFTLCFVVQYHHFQNCYILISSVVLRYHDLLLLICWTQPLWPPGNAAGEALAVQQVIHQRFRVAVMEQGSVWGEAIHHLSIWLLSDKATTTNQFNRNSRNFCYQLIIQSIQFNQSIILIFFNQQHKNVKFLQKPTGHSHASGSWRYLSPTCPVHRKWGALSS